MARKRVRDYWTIFEDDVLTKTNPDDFLKAFKSKFRVLENYVWVVGDYGDSVRVCNKAGKEIPLWKIIDTFEKNPSPRFKGALLHLLELPWYLGREIDYGNRSGLEGPAYWAKIYERIMRALSKYNYIDIPLRIAKSFIGKLYTILHKGDTTVNSPPDGIGSAISLALKMMSKGNVKLMQNSLHHAYEAIRDYYYGLLVKCYDSGEYHLRGILEILKRISRKGTESFLRSQLKSLTSSFYREIYEDFTRKQLAELETDDTRSTGVSSLLEKKKCPRKKFAPLRTVRSLNKDTDNPVKILCIVIDPQPGAAVVQDIFDEDSKQALIKVSVEQTLSIAQKYFLIGDVEVKSGSVGKELRFIASSVYNVDSLDIERFKEAIRLEEKVQLKRLMADSHRWSLER